MKIIRVVKVKVIEGAGATLTVWMDNFFLVSFFTISVGLFHIPILQMLQCH